MIGKPYPNTLNPTVYTSPWETYNDPTAQIHPSSSPSNNNSPYLDALLTAISRYLPSKETDLPVTDSTESDEFRMYEFKVRGCTRSKAHDWTECPFAHPGEKARRRDPRRCSYSGAACADFRKGSCRRGDACEFAHGVFECWLHPTRYRTQVCKDGPNCTRRVCFFAHAPAELRVTSGLPSPGSIGSGSGSFDPFEEVCSGPGSVGELAAKLGNLQLSKVKSMPTSSGWKGRVGLGSPRVRLSDGKAGRAGFYSLPGTPTRSLFQVGGTGYPWEEEPIMEREEVERIGLDNQEMVDYSNMVESGPDIGWVSELVK